MAKKKTKLPKSFEALIKSDFLPYLNSFSCFSDFSEFSEFEVVIRFHRVFYDDTGESFILLYVLGNSGSSFLCEKMVHVLSYWIYCVNSSGRYSHLDFEHTFAFWYNPKCGEVVVSIED